MLRTISVTLRALKKKKEIKRTLAQFGQWSKEIEAIPHPAAKSKKLLIIKLDDIGDYLLFRNTLPIYKKYKPGYEVTLLGFTYWKDLHEYADSAFVDKTIWVNKHELLADEALRYNLWRQLRSEGFEIVICPSRVRPLLLDDLCMLAAAPLTSIATHNDFSQKEWCDASDKLYNQLFANTTLCHEFPFNQAFAKWLYPGYVTLAHPQFPAPDMAASIAGPYLICFVGASFQSRRWTTDKWIEFIQLCKKENAPQIIIAGGKNDIPIAEKIIEATGAESITGKVTLVEMANWINHARAILSNDTMAAHLSVALNKPTVIIASGDNFYKFSEYEASGIKGVKTLYPTVFLHKWEKLHHKPFRNYVAVTKDISTIPAQRVYSALASISQ